IIAGCLALYSQDRVMQKLEKRNSTLRRSLEGHEGCAEAFEALRGEREVLGRSLQAARTQVRSLQKPVPTERDRALFAKLNEEWPWGAGTLLWLRDNFNSKSWSVNTPEQIIHFVEFEGELYFEDKFVDKAFKRFRTACADLVDWLVTESSPGDYNPQMQIVHDGTYRPGGWSEYMDVRQRGEKLAKEVVDSWRSFERIGRSRSL